jgi:hypothetical protein
MIQGRNCCWKDIHHQVLIKFWQKWFKHEIIHYILRTTNSLIVWNKEELPQQCKEPILCLFMKRVIKATIVVTEKYHCNQLCTKCYPILSMLTPCTNKITSGHQCVFQHNKSTIRCSTFVRYRRKNGTVCGFWEGLWLSEERIILQGVAE